jgi:hypothetical protein
MSTGKIKKKIFLGSRVRLVIGADNLTVNPLLKTLLLREENRRLKRNWPIDLI